MSFLIDTTFDLRGYIESRIGGRAENQDSAGFMETALGTVVVVCDGMGGMNGGKVASMLAVQTIIDAVSEAKKNEDPREVLIKAFRQAQKVIIGKASEDPDLKGMGTTATAIIISERAATAAHVGDSRIYQLRGRKYVFRTTDHSMVGQLVAAGTLTEEQARLSMQSNIILKALGVDGDATPNVETLPYLKGDRFVLCTDGFWGAFPEEKFIKLVTRSGLLKDVVCEAAQTIDDQGVRTGGGHDNLTAAFIDVKRESILKPRMSKQQKIILACILAALIGSLCVNVFLAGRHKQDKGLLEATKEFAKTMKSTDKAVDTLQETTKYLKTLDSLQLVHEKDSSTVKTQEETRQ